MLHEQQLWVLLQLLSNLWQNMGSLCLFSSLSGIDTDGSRNQFTDFKDTNLGMPKFNLK